MKKFLSILLILLCTVMLCACSPWGWKYIYEYGDSVWVTNEDSPISIVLTIKVEETGDKKLADVTYEGETKRFSYGDEVCAYAFYLVDENGKEVCENNHWQIFSGHILDATKENVVLYELEWKKFDEGFYGIKDSEREGKFTFTLNRVIE